MKPLKPLEKVKYFSLKEQPGEVQILPPKVLLIILLVNALLTVIFLSLIEHPRTTSEYPYYYTKVIGAVALSASLLLFALRRWVLLPFFQGKRKALQALQASETLYKNTFTQAAVGVAHVGLDGRWKLVNEKLCSLLGYSAEELHQLRFQDITHKDDLADDLDLALKLIAGEISHYDMEKRYIHKNGGTVWVKLNVSLVRKTDNNPDFFISIIEDITDKKKTEKTAALLGRILEVSLNEVYTFDATTLYFTSVNVGARNNLGYTMEEMQSLTPFDIKPEFSQQSFSETIAPLKNGAQDKITFETIHKRKNGTFYPVEVHLQFAAREDPPVFVAIILDITERVRLTRDLHNTVDQLRHASKAKSDFLASMSHELRTPLNTIIKLSKVIGTQHLGEIQQNQYIDHAKDIETNSLYLLDLINNILDISKIDFGNYTIEKAQINLIDIVEGCASLLKQRVEDKRIILKMVHADIPLGLLADARALKQALINILGNALRFTPEGGAITISTKIVQNNALLSVKDTGPGIPEGDLPKLMMPYVALQDTPETSEESSSRLGLSITRTLISLHDGTMEIHSQEGNGTEVIIKLPI